MDDLKPTTDRFANRHGYSDVTPYEIIRIVSDKCLEIRAMVTSENKTPLHFEVGGFSAHCTNQTAQEYEYTRDPINPIKRIRLNKVGTLRGAEANLVWKDKFGRDYLISEEPEKFYDFNF